MGLGSKEIVSEKTLIQWLVYSTLATIGFALLGAVIVYLAYSCWPLGAIVKASGSCLDHVQPTLLIFLPLLLGVITGTGLTIKFK
jgi:hypothetical protein